MIHRWFSNNDSSITQYTVQHTHWYNNNTNKDVRLRSSSLYDSHDSLLARLASALAWISFMTRSRKAASLMCTPASWLPIVNQPACKLCGRPNISVPHSHGELPCDATAMQHVPCARTDFAASRNQSLDDAVQLVGLAAGLAHFGHDHVAIDASIGLRLALDAHEAVLLAVVEPVARSAGSNQPLQLVRLDPDHLLDRRVAPELEALTAELHRTARDPQETEAVVLQALDIQRTHLVVRQRSVR